MPRLIDAEFICEHIEEEMKDIEIPRCPYAKRKDSEYNIGYNSALTIAKAIAKTAPTIEAEPVRHGEWVHTDKAASWKCKDECGECHYHTADRVDLSCLNYCPNCGAKMDGKVDKNEN